MSHTDKRNIKNQNHAQPSTAGVTEMIAATNNNTNIWCPFHPANPRWKNLQLKDRGLALYEVFQQVEARIIK